MTASLKGSISINTTSINTALKRIKDLDANLKILTDTTNAFKQAEASYKATVDKSVTSLSAKLAKEKERTVQLRESLAKQKEQIQVERERANSIAMSLQKEKQSADQLAKNAVLNDRATRQVERLNQQIRQSKLDADNQTNSFKQLASALATYQAEVDEANGDVAMLSQAKNKLDDATHNTTMTLREHNKMLQIYSNASKKTGDTDKENASIKTRVNAELVRSSEQVQNLIQKVRQSNVASDQQALIIKELNGVLSDHTNLVKKVGGDTNKLKDAQTQLKSSVGGITREFNEYNGQLSRTLTQETAKIRAIDTLTRRMLQSEVAIKNTTLSQAEQSVQIARLKANYDAAKMSIQELGTQAPATARAVATFNEQIVRQSNSLRNSLAGVGRGAGQAGIQVQQFVGQIQGGVDPMIALSQQSADLGWALGMPMAGAISGIAFSMGTFLAPAMFNGKDAVEEMTEALTKLQETAVGMQGSIRTVSDEILEIAKIDIEFATSKADLELANVTEQVKKSVETINEAFASTLDRIDFKKYEDYNKTLEPLIQSIIKAKENGEDFDSTLNKLQNSTGVKQYEQMRMMVTGLGVQFGLSGEKAFQFGEEILKAYQLVKQSPTPENIQLLVKTVDQARVSVGELSKRGRESLDNLFKALKGAKEFSEVSKILTEFSKATPEGKKEQAFAGAIDTLQKSLSVLQAEMDDGKIAAENLQKAIDLGAVSFDALPVKLQNLILEERRLKEALDSSTKSQQEADQARKSMLNNLIKMQQQLALTNIKIREGEDAHFRLQQAMKLGKDSFADLSEENKLLVEQLLANKKKLDDLNESQKQEAQQVKTVATLISNLNTIRQEQQAYTNASTKEELQANLAQVKQQEEMQKTIDVIKSLSVEKLGQLAVSLNLSKGFRTEEELINDVTQAYLQQMKTLNELKGKSLDAPEVGGVSKAFRELQKMATANADTGSFSGIADSLRADASAIAQAANDSIAQGIDPKLATDTMMKALDLNAQEYLNKVQELNQKVNQITQFSPLSDTEKLFQDFTERKDALAQIFGEESDLYKEHLSSLKNQYEQQNFHMEFAKQFGAANDIIGGAMSVFQTLGKQNSKEYQKLAIGQAIIQQAMAVNSVWADPSLPVWAKVGMSVMAGAQVAAQIKQIRSQSFSTGGYVSGEGTSTSDSIAARLSDGEYVIRANAVRRLGVDYLDQINEGRMPMLAMGGSVGKIENISSNGNSFGNMTVQLINEGNVNMEVTSTEQTVSENGDPMLKMYITNVVREEMRNGQFDKAMSKNYGVARQPTRR